MQTSESSAMPAADAAPAFYTAVASNGCALAQYSASTEEGVIFNVLSVARNEGFKGSGLDRLIELGWVVRPVYTQPAAQGMDAKDAARYRFIKKHSLILSGGTREFGWPISPFGVECDRYIDKELAAQAKQGGV